MKNTVHLTWFPGINMAVGRHGLVCSLYVVNSIKKKRPQAKVTTDSHDIRWEFVIRATVSYLKKLVFGRLSGRAATAHYWTLFKHHLEGKGSFIIKMILRTYWTQLSKLPRQSFKEIQQNLLSTFSSWFRSVMSPSVSKLRIPKCFNGKHSPWNPGTLVTLLPY